MRQWIAEYFRTGFKLDLRSLALMRIFTAALVIHDAVMRFASARAFTTAEGVLPLSALPSPEVYFRSPLNALSDTAAFQYLLLSLLIAAAALLLIGYRTRFTTILVWFMLGSLHERNVLILHSSDTILRLTLFWGIFLPWGECFSWRNERKPATAGGYATGVATLGYMLQVACIYVFSVAFKTGADWRNDFTAVYYALQVGEFGGSAATWLTTMPVVTKFLTAAVLLAEFFAPLLFFIPRLRLFGVLSLLMMHAGFLIFLNLGPFPLIASAGLVGLLPATFWNRISHRAADTIESQAIRAPRWQNIIAGVMIVCVLGWNLLAIPPSPYKPTPLFINFARVLHIDQNWAMFSPQPPHISSWITASAHMRSGGTQDIWNKTAIPEKPTRQEMRESFADWRWFKYLQNLAATRRSDDLMRFAQYLCRLAPDAVHVEVYQHRLPTPAPGEAFASAQRQLLSESACRTP